MATNSPTDLLVPLVAKLALVAVVAVILLLLGALAGCWDSGAQGRSGGFAMVAVPDEYVVTFGRGIPGVPLTAGGAAGALLPGDQRLQAVRIRAAIADSVAAEAAATAAGGKIEFRYRTAVIGFSGKLAPAALAAVRRSVSQQPHIEPNWEASQWPEGARNLRTAAEESEDPLMSPGLDRIGQRLLPLNISFQRSVGGSGEIHAYVIDSGIRGTHSQFARADENGGSRVADGVDFVPVAPEDDCLEHGTHVAGTIGGKSLGVAPDVELHSVRVINCAGKVKLSRAVAGINWVLEDYLARGKPAVANASWGFDLESVPKGEMAKLFSMEVGIKNSIYFGLVYVVAAGNGVDDVAIDACGISPARLSAVITVGSVNPDNDTKAESSNFGGCLDLFAPGVTISSASSIDDETLDFRDGTSHAAPHVAGVAALFLSSNLGAAPDAVWKAIEFAANDSDISNWCGVLERGEDSPNRLLYWGGGAPDGTADNEPTLAPPPTCPASPPQKR